MSQDSTQTHRRRGAAFWRRTIRAHERSGLTQLAFCRRNELALSTFQYWRRRLRDTEDEAATDFVEVEVRSEASAPQSEVTVPQSTLAAGADGFELTFPSGLRLKVPRQVEGRALAEVLWALEATGAC